MIGAAAETREFPVHAHALGGEKARQASNNGRLCLLLAMVRGGVCKEPVCGMNDCLASTK